MPRSRYLPWPSTRVERDVFESLRQLAAEQGRPVTNLVAEAVDQYVIARDERSPTTAHRSAPSVDHG